jgi:hypothetical protein
MAYRIAWKLAGIALIAGSVLSSAGRAQEAAPAAAPLPEQTQPNAAAPCEQPPPMVRWQDYNGKFAKIVGAVGRRVERKSVHPPHYKPGALLCTFEPKDKFWLFVQDTYDPLTFLNAGFNAGIGQAENTDPSFGQGAAGYGKRFGANYAGQISSEFFISFAYPAIFSEDPRYYRLAHGGGRRRLLHAIGHVFVAHKDEDGRPMFNFSEWLGTTSAVVLSNTYHPDNKRGFGPAAQNVGLSFASDMGYDVLREFWPEVARKLKLPFRDQNEQKKLEPVADTK